MCYIPGGKRKAYRILMGKPERYRRRWEGNLKVNLKEIIWENMNWICLAEDWDKWLALMNRVVNFQVPQNVGNFVNG